MSYLRYLCLFVYSGVQHILCNVFLRLGVPMLTVSLDCPFLIATLVFYNIYLIRSDIGVNEHERLSHFMLRNKLNKGTTL